MSRKRGKKAHKPRPYARENHAFGCRVANAVVKAKMDSLESKMDSGLTKIGIENLMADHGADDPEMLAHLAWVIGVGAEVAAAEEPGSVLARRLHGALRSIITMSVNRAWDASQAAIMTEMAEESKRLLVTHPKRAASIAAGADHLAALILNRRATLRDVAGAEFYQTTKPETQPQPVAGARAD